MPRTRHRSISRRAGPRKWLLSPPLSWKLVPVQIEGGGLYSLHVGPETTARQVHADTGLVLQWDGVVLPENCNVNWMSEVVKRFQGIPRRIYPLPHEKTCVDSEGKLFRYVFSDGNVLFFDGRSFRKCQAHQGSDLELGTNAALHRCICEFIHEGQWDWEFHNVNLLTPTLIGWIVLGVSCSPEVEWLHFSSCGLDGACVARIAPLAACPHLTTLQLLDCDLSVSDLQPLTMSLSSSDATLDQLTILGPGCNDEAALLMASMLTRNASLSSFTFGTHLTDVGVAALAAALEYTRSLYSLKLVGRITSTGAITLATSLSHTNILESIDLSQNQISDNGALALVSTLVSNGNSLRNLNLIGNRVGYETVELCRDKMLGETRTTLRI